MKKKNKLLTLLGAMHHECIRHNWDSETEKEYQEIIQKLLEYGELKKMLHDIVDPLIDVCEFMLAVLGEDE